MKKIITIIRKEWAEVFKNRMVIFTILFMPILFTALPLILLAVMGNAGVGDMTSELPPQFSQLCPPNLTGGECFQVYLASQFTLLFLMMPVIIPVNIAAYSIVGEKTTRSLEPLLATPITTVELLVGKTLAAAIPAILATWAGFTVYCIGVLIMTSSAVAKALITPTWLIAIMVVGPLMAILSVNFSIMVSSRVNDPRTAEQISTVVILPVLILFIGQITGYFFLNNRIIWLIALGTLLVDLVMVYVARGLFQREVILTRWK